MKDQKVMEKEFKALEGVIERLKRAEKELDSLKSFENIFGSQMESIRQNLKRPDKVDVVELALGYLRGEIEKHKQRAAEGEVKKRQPSQEPVPPPRLPTSFPRELEGLYADVSFIGSGGFATVFRAKRRKDSREVAVKVPINRDPATGKSFIREITAWQHLNHRNIVKLYDLNIYPIAYLEMELCEKSLDDLSKPLETEQAATLVFHIGEGVKYAHAQGKEGIIHRDLKPHNVLLQGEVPKIGDWGLSKVVAESKSSSGSDFTPLYAAPEQLSPQKFAKPDHRTDIYQLGAIFYELVTAKPPFEGDNLAELIGQILSAEPKSPSLLNPEASGVEHIIMKCLCKEMRERYQSMAEMQQDLAQYLKVEYKDSLSKSRGNMGRSGYYCCELCLVHLTAGDLEDALKYAQDLNHYASEGRKSELASLIGELEYIRKENMSISEELVDRAAIVLHQVKMGR